MRLTAVRWTMIIVLFVSGGSAAAAVKFQPFVPLPDEPPIPADNPQTDAKVSLGRALYFDRRLSYDRSLSCNSCHDLMAGGADSRAATSPGALGKAAARSAPTLWNVAFETVYYWDGRATSLEQALEEHLVSPTEMAMPDRKSLLARLAAIDGYRQQFDDVFSGEGGLNYRNVTRALASYLRTLVTSDSDFDRYLRGDRRAISAKARRGFRVFIDTGCASCHFWVNLAGPIPGLAFQMGEGFYELFPNFTGSEAQQRYALAEDLGRYYITNDDRDKRMWRVAPLRNIALTAPYFHNGSVAELDEAIRVMALTQLGVKLTRAEIGQIEAFLRTLSGRFPPQPLPRLP